MSEQASPEEAADTALNLELEEAVVHRVTSIVIDILTGANQSSAAGTLRVLLNDLVREQATDVTKRTLETLNDSISKIHPY